jgi:hypothetical protein
MDGNRFNIFLTLRYNATILKRLFARSKNRENSTTAGHSGGAEKYPETGNIFRQ